MSLLSITMPRVTVDEFSPNDLHALQGIFQRMDEKGQPWFNASGQDQHSVQRFLDTAIANQDGDPRDTYRMAIRLREDDGQSKLIGYVSLCKIFSQENGVPDTGIFVDPEYQRGKYAREARLGIMMFGFWMGIAKMYCDIAQKNVASQNNVLGMGYEQQLDADQKPETFATNTIDGVEQWFRYGLSREKFVEVMPGLMAAMQPKWDIVTEATMSHFNEAVAAFALPTIGAKTEWGVDGLVQITHRPRTAYEMPAFGSYNLPMPSEQRLSL